MLDRELTRRDALKVIGGTAGGFAATGIAVADEGSVRANVGYDSTAGRAAVVQVADEVIYEFAFDALTIKASEEAIDTLSAVPDIRYAERDSKLYTLEQTLPWGIDRVDAEVAHTNGDTGSGADIAIIDTGIDQFHEDLADNLGEGVAFLGGTQSNNWQDDNGHGTHCAGIADAIDNSIGVVGVSTDATLHAVKVMQAVGAGLTSDIAKGIEWTADQGYDVGSLSLGGGDSDTLREACQYADDNGVFLSAAAGNSGPCEDCVSYPAAYEECVAVSATAQDDSLAGFSSTGPEVELAAPGEAIFSTYVGNSYATLDGTSMACPHVSGAAGQLMANGDSNTEARNQLNPTAEDIGLSGNEQGNGLLDVAAALGYDSSDDL